MSGKRACSQFPECSISYAKINKKTNNGNDDCLFYRLLCMWRVM